jgi:hypothetical protein
VADDKVMQSEQQAQTMDSGTYEVIKNRLSGQGDDLKEALEQLNSARKDVFGSIETKLSSSERIITENNCVPRDMVPVGHRFIFGYNVHIGLKSKPLLSDVFSVFKYEEGRFESQSLDLIQDPTFKKDFDDLYLYYKKTFFAKFTIIEPYLYMVFQVGDTPDDIKVFKWLMEDDQLRYVDNRSEHEVKFDRRNEFKFQRATRDHQRNGLHPHISILDRVFVETIGGDLTIKVEDNTETGTGIYSEAVDDPDQTLDDSEVWFADLGQLIILKVLPFKELEYRYFIFNDKLKHVVRIDSIEDTCLLLPGGHGLIFPAGYYLQNGEYKVFDVPSENCVFDLTNSSSNGEDYQYIFYNMDSGIYLIYSYNVIEQTIDTPIVCSGYSHFDNGEMIVFRHEAEPRKNHMIQVWQTPYVGKDFEVSGQSDSELYKIGNKSIVECMAECRVVGKLIQKGESYESVYVDIVKISQTIMDSYFWLANDEAYGIQKILKEVKETATFAIGEYEKVNRIRKATVKEIGAVQHDTDELLSKLEYGTFDHINDYVDVLTEIRQLGGRIVSLRDLRYTDLELVDALDQQVKIKNDEFALKCMDFLMEPEGMKPYEDQVEHLKEEISSIEKSVDGLELDAKMDNTSEDLELMMDIVSNFKVEDPTITTAIIEKISNLFSLLNHAKAKLKSRIDSFNKSEMSVQFNAQMKLLSQAVVNYLDLADSEEKCQQYLNKAMVQIQELEGKFSEFDDYLVILDEKREEVYSAFETKKQSILDKLNRRLVALFESAERILKGIATRISTMDSVEAINGYLATDIMAEKVRDITAQLKDLGDTVKADEITARLKTLRENTIRQLKDKQDLYLDGENVIKFGKHHFSVNTKAIDVSIVQKEERLFYHITGTDFWDPVEDDRLSDYIDVFNQSLVSENRDVYRCEYLAYSMMEESLVGHGTSLSELQAMESEERLQVLRQFMEPRYQEGYTKGVHDQDALLILESLLNLYTSIDLLIYSPDVRALARLYWNHLIDKKAKTQLTSRLKTLKDLAKITGKTPELDSYVPSIVAGMKVSFEMFEWLSLEPIEEAAEYLCREVIEGEGFVVSYEANEAIQGFERYIQDIRGEMAFRENLQALDHDIEGQYFLVESWLLAYHNELVTGEAGDLAMSLQEYIPELIMLILDGPQIMQRVVKTPSNLMIEGLVGTHPVIINGQYSVHYNQFMDKMDVFYRKTRQRFNDYQALKKELLNQFRKKLRLEDFEPNVLTSFVRNKLIDDVYLPLVGDNLAKQIGEVGEKKRTDLMGLLLLVSPPGYGKTTLMEYIANRLGVILVKVNGPSIGHEVTSLDPDKASHSGAREELRKLNLALKMGNNVMIYLDDIQHLNPEFLQKFISLCDGQRKMDGVYNGEAQTYDLRGKKVAVVMAGNPYTESGETFKIPDMLANRADVYNLGDMLHEDEEAFKLSYIENSLTSNPVLSKLSNSSPKDLYGLIDIAKGADRESVELDSRYSIDELNEYTRVIENLFKVRDIVLKVNMEYIYSAAQAEEYRTEPAFKLQGSYRNMNKIAEKVYSVMNEEELFKVIQGSYENDCQTLTTGAEFNMLKWKELVEHIDDDDLTRLKSIRQIYGKNKLVKGDDKIGQAVIVLSELSEHIGSIKGLLSNHR